VLQQESQYIVGNQHDALPEARHKKDGLLPFDDAYDVRRDLLAKLVLSVTLYATVKRCECASMAISSPSTVGDDRLERVHFA
jgi:hypothetical protein